MIKDKFTFLIISIGLIFDYLIVWWLFRTFDVVPDYLEEMIKRIPT